MGHFTLTGFGGHAQRALARAGYTKRKHGDWVKPDSSGRWHAKLTPRGWQVHYDLYLDEKEHFSPHLPLAMGQEHKRIKTLHTTNAIPDAPRQGGGVRDRGCTL